mmetsp:Transcript_78763/g.231090  ORF Transcript_78763/g.231090 Transcript_78763/m.231090 type:complete len:213 (+) Transcript_78763:68-706(+)
MRQNTFSIPHYCRRVAAFLYGRTVLEILLLRLLDLPGHARRAKMAESASPPLSATISLEGEVARRAHPQVVARRPYRETPWLSWLSADDPLRRLKEEFCTWAGNHATACTIQLPERFKCKLLDRNLLRLLVVVCLETLAHGPERVQLQVYTGVLLTRAVPQGLPRLELIPGYPRLLHAVRLRVQARWWRDPDMLGIIVRECSRATGDLFPHC